MSGHDTPTFAVVGAVNHGKSSVVATLAENDRVRVSPMPGETVENQSFKLGELFVFHDTPGFQNAREALTELRDAATDAHPLKRFATFIQRHRDDPAFDAECRLFEPVVQGAGIVYVVDASRPLRDIHNAEMELMRLTGAPRLAIINRTGPDQHGAEWKLRLGQHFNAVREFDAHAAHFADRIELLDTLAGIEQRWKPRLMQAVQVLRADREQRLNDASNLIVDWLAQALPYRESERNADEPDEAILARFRDTLATRETAVHAALIALFSHHHVQAPTDAASTAATLFADDLFSEATWSMLGLDARQLLRAGTAAGAAVGAGTDVLTAGHTLLLGTTLGAAVGAASALALGKRRPELAVRLPAAALPGPLRALMNRGLRVPDHFALAGRARGVGPYGASNFPWILIDRAFGTLACAALRSHARRDDEQLDSARLHGLLSGQHLASSEWPADDRRRAESCFDALRRERAEPADREALRALLRRWMSRLDVVRAPPQVPASGPGPTIRR
jgi:hypothetical protein